ncbi:MAG: VCBS repeat-containing protein [Chloroflexi bacterium]|nr:VCBS repeat-containing protein [Chloroflexota bacterium]
MMSVDGQDYFANSGTLSVQGGLLQTEVSYPASHPDVIAVGACTDFGFRADYSQYTGTGGKRIDIVAPSGGGTRGIFTTDRIGTDGYNNALSPAGDFYDSFSGTSAASPLVAGIGALVLSANNELRGAEVRQILHETADQIDLVSYDAQGWNPEYGYGRVNAYAAVREALARKQTVATPTISPNEGSFTDSVQVTLDCATADATITYTTSGSDPTASSTVYTAPFTLTSSATIKAKAFKSGFNDSAVAAASFTVTQQNLAPTISNISNQTTNEDTTVGPLQFTIGDDRTPPGSLNITLSSSNRTLVPESNITPGGSGANRTLSVKPAVNEFGTTTINVTVTDGGGASASDSFVLTVNPVNDAPSFTKGTNPTVDEDSGAGSIIGWATGISPGPANEVAQTVRFDVTNNNSVLFLTQPTTSPDGTLTFTPAPNANGSATTTVILRDNGGTADGGIDASAPQTFTITVNPVNDPPTLNPLADLTISGTTNLTLTGITAGPANEIQSLTVSAASTDTTLVSAAVAYTSPNTTGSLTLTPASGRTGTARITVTVKDDGGTANGGLDITNQSFAVNVIAPSPAGRLQFSQPGYSVVEGAGLVALVVQRVEGTSGAVSVSFVTSDGSAIAAEDYQAASGTLNWANGDAANKTLTITILNNSLFETNETFAINLTNPTGGASLGDPSAAVVTIVDDDPQPPQPPIIIVQPQSQSVTAGQTAEFVAAASGTPAPALRWQRSVNGGSTWEDLSNGGGISGTATETLSVANTTTAMSGHQFLLKATNSAGTTNSNPATLTVNQVGNTPPTVSATGPHGTQKNTPTPPIPFTVNDVETPAANLLLSKNSSNPTLVPLSGIVFGGGGSSRTVTITPATDQTGTADITIIVTDADGLSASTTFTLAVGTNQRPVWTSDAVRNAGVGRRYEYAAHAFDPEGAPLQYSAPTLPGWLTAEFHGSVIQTIAGTLDLGDGGPANNAWLLYPLHVAADGAGNLYVSDLFGHRVWQVGTDGVIHAFAGTGERGSHGDGGPATSAGLNSNMGLAVDGSRGIYIADTDNHRIRRVAPDGIITTFAGTGERGFSGDGDPAISARLNYPFAVAVASSGTVYVADTYNRRIRRITPDGVITTVAGNGETGEGGEGGPAVQARLNFPTALAVDAAQNIYVADYNNHKVRRVGTDGIIVTVAGTGTAGYSGDGSLASAAQLNSPFGVALDAAGNILVGDMQNQRVRRVGIDGTITTIAGTGEAGFSGDGGPAGSAVFNWPRGLTVDQAGNVYVCDNLNHVVRRISAAGVVTSVAGKPWSKYPGEGGLATQAPLGGPTSVAVDAGGNVHVTDIGYHIVRRISPEGLLTTVAGSGAAGYGGDGGAATAASFHDPYGVAVDQAGNLYVADFWGHRVRRIGADGVITTIAGTGPGGEAGGGFSGDGGKATEAVLNRPKELAVDAQGNVYVVDLGNRKIRRIGVDGIIRTIAGTGEAGYNGDGQPATAAQLSDPWGIAVGRSGDVFLADTFNHRIRRIGADGIISTIAGTGEAGYSGDGGPAVQAQLDTPVSIATDNDGNVYIADFHNHRIRRIGPDQQITTVAGTGVPGLGSDGTPAASAQLRYPQGLAVDQAGNLYFADYLSRLVRKISRNELSLSGVPTESDLGEHAVVLRVSDGLNAVEQAFTIRVHQAPIISTIGPQVTPKNTPTPAIPFTVGDAETPAANLLLSKTSSNPTLVPVNNIVFGGSGTNRTVTVTPATGMTGTAQITLTVRDTEGLTATSAFQMTVTTVPPPVAGFSGIPASGPAPLMVTLTDTSTGSITNRAWSFGDGSTVNTNATSFTHRYASQGTYTVSLTVNGAGGSHTLTRANYFFVGPPRPVDFTKVDGSPVTSESGGAGIAWGDYNGDGWIDLIVARGGDGAASTCALYRNDGNGNLARITTGPVVTDVQESQGAIWGDYDNNGHLDLFVHNVRGPNSLYHNNGDGTFSKVNEPPFSTDSSYCPGAAWGDYDNDGFIDLVVAARDGGPFLYHNNRNGTFTKITTGPVVTDGNGAYGSAWGDYDNDGWLDLVVTRPGGTPHVALYHNNRDGTFARVTEGPVAAESGGGPIAPAWGDYDNDGNLDLLIVKASSDEAVLFRNEGSGRFTRVDHSVLPPNGAANGAGWEDYDNDGFLDLFIEQRNYLFRNNGNGTFTKVTDVAPVLDVVRGFGIAWGDYDNDGYPDLAVGVYGGNTALYRNNGGPDNWLKLNLVGTRSNRNGIGAKVRVTATIRGVQRTLLRQVASGSVYGSPNSLDVSFGLGDASIADAVVVEWPSGTVQLFAAMLVNQSITVTEPAAP